ncbi:MAG: helix-turn-helix transcriptional regulator [Rubrivivax sp.]
MQSRLTAASTLPPPPAGRLLHRADICRTVDLVGAGYEFCGGQVSERTPLLDGLFHTLELRPGFVLHRTRLCDLQSLRTRVQLKPGLKLSLVVGGQVEVAMGSRRFRLGPRRAAAGGWHNDAALVALAEPAPFERIWQRGRHERKVSLTLLPEWLAASGLAAHPRVRDFCASHLATLPWRPSARIQALAEQIIQAPPLQPGLLNLYLESRAIEIAAEALSLIAGEPAAAPLPAPPRERERQRLLALRDWLDSGAADGCSLAQIAHHAGMSASALEAGFRTCTGASVFGYLRQRRLDAARRALEQQGVSVARAADIAGYTSAANFATAFRRRYGQTPREARLRC